MAKYIPLEREKHWQQFWQDNGVYQFDQNSEKPIFSVDTPPPTVSGKLHMGHVFSYTQAEVIARYRRLAGFNVFYPFGMDDNGLPTEKLVETELGIKGSDSTRDEFIQKCLSVVDGYHQKYRDLWQSLGFSVDWRLEYSTISPEVQKLTQTNFVELFKKGIIYRQKSPSLWCSVCQTSVAQAEVEDKQFDSIFYDIVFYDENNKEIIVATTRPELLPACVAVFVNPDDKRYQNLIGTKIYTPLDVPVSVLADPKAQIEKGTGIVMCCTYGDETDLAWKSQHNLEEKIILDATGRFNEICSEEYMRGLTVTEGRKAIVEFLKSKNLVKKELSIVHDVGCHERCGHPIEIINTDQWFVKVLDIKDKLVTMADKINWYPVHMKARYISWVENLKWDWCISRDRFYGIPVPAFYCQQCGEIIVPEIGELPLDPLHKKISTSCPKCASNDLLGDKLVLDTWFTSGNTPEINCLLNQNLTGSKIKLPMTLRPQAHDIIRTWAFYTIVLAYYKNNINPWFDAAISGHILLRKGEKISKRNGGGDLRPEEQITLHSADAIRFAMCGAALGQDAYYDEKELENGKKLVNKLFNAANFCFMNLSDYQPIDLNIDSLTPIDKWLILKTKNTANTMSKYFDKYDYSHARDVFTTFFWGTFCDYYLEIVKKRIYELPSSDPTKISAQTTLFYALKDLLIMVAPFIPHITEEIYQSYYPDKLKNAPKSLHQSLWPKVEDRKDLEKIDEIVTSIFEIIAQTRSLKTQNGLNLGAEIETLNIVHPTFSSELLKDYEYDLKAVTRAKEIKLTSGSEVKVSL